MGARKRHSPRRGSLAYSRRVRAKSMEARIRAWPKLSATDEPILVVFGSPEKGIHEIIGGKMNKVQNAKSLNFFPNQATETVRLEEAILGTLAILNVQNTS